MENNFLNANEISCRVQQISEKGLSLLLYVTSRDGQKGLMKNMEHSDGRTDMK